MQPLLLTLELMGLSVLIALILGIVGAWGASVLDAGGPVGRWLCRFFVVAMVLTICFPMILHAAAWEATAGKFGWTIMTQTGVRGGVSSPYGFFSGLLACAWIHGLFGGALVALACRYGTRLVPDSVIDQSRLDCSPVAQWFRIRLPLAKKWWLTALIAAGLLAATEMTVVDLYGYRTIADEFYLIYSADPSIGSVLMTCAVPLVLLCSTMVWWLMSRRRLVATKSPRGSLRQQGDQPTFIWRCLALVITLLLPLIMVVVPVMGLVIKIGHEVVVQDGEILTTWSVSSCWERILEAPAIFSAEYGWTAVIAVSTAGAALLITWPIASLARTRPRWEKFFDLSTIALVVIPGPVIAMLVVMVFQYDVPGFRLLYQRTIFPTMIALSARAIPVAYWLIRAAYRSVEDSVLDLAALEMSWTTRMRTIDFPVLRRHLTLAFLVTAIVASGDVPATLPILPPGVSTVGTRLFGLLHSGARYQEASLAIWYVAAISLISLFLLRQRIVERILK